MTKPTLVLLPGLICDEALWSHQARAFADSFELIYPDVSGDDDIVRLAATVLASLPERFLLTGLSMGGYVALEMIRQAPARVERLALLGTSARADTDWQARRRRGLIALSRRGTFKGVTPRLLPQLLHPSRLDDVTLVETITAMAARVGRDGFINQQKTILSRQDARDLLPSISCPTLVLCGRDDQMTPPDLSREIASAIPGAELVLIDDCGHLPPLERPDQTIDALARWLDVVE
jgi:pimeloyl-ACP methyl ester carboxylesterase